MEADTRVGSSRVHSDGLPRPGDIETNRSNSSGGDCDNSEHYTSAGNSSFPGEVQGSRGYAPLPSHCDDTSQYQSAASTRQNEMVLMMMTGGTVLASPASASSNSDSRFGYSTTNNTIDQEVNNDPTSKKLIIALTIFASLELLCFMKFIFLPAAMISLVGGPFIITLPWILWALVNYIISYILCFCKANNLEPSLKSFYVNIYKHVGSCLLPRHHLNPSAVDDSSLSPSLPSLSFDISSQSSTVRPEEVAESMLTLSSSTATNSNQTFEFQISSKELVINSIWSSIDVLLSLVTIVISVGLSLILVEPDQIIRSGWRSQYGLCVAEIVFCFISILSRIGYIIVVVLLDKRKNKSSSCMSKDWRIFLVDKSHYYFQFKAILSIIYAVLSVIAFGFLIGSVHAFLAETYYRNHHIGDKYSDCDPLVPSACMLPFPSSYWLTTDSTSITGYKVNVGADTLAYSKYNRYVTAQPLNSYDGFSVSGALLWKLDSELDDSELISFRDIAKSTLLNSTTLIIDASTKEFFPHFSENDYLEPSDEKRIQYSVPARSLHYNTEYIVVVKGIKDKLNGGQIKPSKLINCYISKYLSGNADSCVDTSDPRYTVYQSSIFPLLVSVGISLSDVQLVWNFHTASESSILGPLTSLYNSTVSLALKARQHNGRSIDYKQTSFTSYDCKSQSNLHSIAASVYYRINVPWYLDSVDPYNNYISPKVSNLTDWSDIDKTIPIMGDVGLLIQVPCSVANEDLPPSAILEAGHGIFGNRGQLHWGWLSDAAQSNGWLMWAADWKGFSTYDIPILVKMMMFDGNVVKTLEDQVLQGFASKLYIKEIIDVIIERESEVLLLSSTVKPLVRSLPKRFLGVSMGGILGAGYCAFSKYSDAVFLVAGSPFTFILGRSALFNFYVRFMDLQYYSRTNIRIIVTAMQVFMDKAESAGWANSGVYQNTSYMLQVALGDATVTTISSRILAFNLNSSLIVPSVIDVYGVPPLNQALPAAAAVGRNFFSQSSYPGNRADLPSTSKFPTKYSGVHNCFPAQSETVEQFSSFLTQRKVENPCNPDACVFDDYATCS